MKLLNFFLVWFKFFDIRNGEKREAHMEAMGESTEEIHRNVRFLGATEVKSLNLGKPTENSKWN